MMIDTQLVPRGIKQTEVLHAMFTVPRHIFVEDGLYSQAYSDFPLPIGEKQTISQPYMVALMTESLGLTGKEKVLEIGTGSGYQTAVLSFLAEKIYSIERISTIASRARRTLDALHCSNVIIRVGDGTLGWPEEAPFDAIIAAAASPRVPSAYIGQLRPGRASHYARRGRGLAGADQDNKKRKQYRKRGPWRMQVRETYRQGRLGNNLKNSP